MIIAKGSSESFLGELGVPSTFVIHSKAPGFVAGSGSRSSILAAAKQTFELLKSETVRLILKDSHYLWRCCLMRKSS